MTYDNGDDIFLMVLTYGTTCVLIMMTKFAQKVIKTLGVLHLFFMEFWMIRMTHGDGDDIF